MNFPALLRASRAFAAALAVLVFYAVLPAADWPSWRGANSDGVSPETGLPETWSQEGENLVWKAPVGGRSTPVVFDGRVCVSTLAEPEDPKKWQARIVCLDEKTGQIRWDYRYSIFQTDIPHHRVGWASPAGDPETGHLYVLGVEGMMMCFDRDGKIVWQRSLEEQIGRISGFGGRTVTPVIDGEKVLTGFLNAGWGPNFIPRHRVYAMDKKSGETIWVSTPGGAPYDTTYSAPVIRVINGQRQIIDGNGDGAIYGLQAGTGKRLWGFPLSKRGINSSVVVDGTRVFASHSEENVDSSTAMGRIVALDVSKINDGKPEQIWMVDGFQAGYASPTLDEGILYHIDNGSNLAAFAAGTGKELWRRHLGIAQRASPVIADGKMFVADVDGQFHILKLRGEQEPEVLDVEEFKNKDGSLTQINGSPAVANGRVYLLTNNDLYAIGYPAAKSAPPLESKTPPVEKAPAGAEAAVLQVIPAEFNLYAGGGKTFRARTLDEAGRVIGEAGGEWSIEGLRGSISPRGELQLGDENTPQGGKVIAKAAGLTGEALISVRQVIPFTMDFESIAEEKVPPGWPAAQGRFQVVTEDGNKILYKMSGNPRTWRTTVYIGSPAAKGYEISAEVRGSESRRRMPDIGLVSHRYTVALMGNQQRLEMRTWLSELERFSADMPFAWDPAVWYQMLFRVEAGDSGPAKLKVKVWKKGEPEPGEWTLEAEDPLPHRHGSPGIYGYSVADIHYDNVKVAPITP